MSSSNAENTDPIPTAQSFGAVGDGVTNDTAAFLAFGIQGGPILIPPGIYLVDPLVFNKPVYIQLLPGAVMRLRSIRTSDCAVLQFAAAAAGSVVTGGGEIDGNRSSLLAGYLALPHDPQYGGDSYVIQTEINGILAEACERIRVSNVTIRNALTHGFVHRGGDGAIYEDIRIYDCAKVANFQFAGGGRLRNISASGIGNLMNGTPLPFWQPGLEIRDTSRTDFENIRISSFAPAVRDNAGHNIGDPIPCAFTFERIDGGAIRGLEVSSYTYTPSDRKTTSISMGFYGSSLRGVQMSGISITGYYYGMEVQSIENCNLSGLTVDGLYNITATNAVTPSADAAGLRIRGGGINPFATSQPINDYRANSCGRNNIWGNCLIQRSTIGVQCLAGGQVFDNVRSIGHIQSGWQIDISEPNTSFPAAPRPAPIGVTLNGCQGIYNGWSGLFWVSGQNLTISGGNFDNNGQETSEGFASCGLNTITNQPKTGGYFAAATACDTQNFLKARGASFVPGKTDTFNQMQILTVDPSGLEIGQRIKVKKALAGGGDANFKIVDINKDVLLCQAAGLTTLVEAGNLVGLTGTISSSGNMVTGSGTHFAADIPGACVIKAAGQYRRVAKIYNDTSLQTVAPFSPTIPTGTAIQVIWCDLAGMPSQKYGVQSVDGVKDLKCDIYARGNTIADTKILAKHALDEYQSYVPNFISFGGGGISVSGLCKYIISGKMVHIKGYARVSYSVAPAVLTFSLPPLAIGDSRDHLTDGAGFVIGSNSDTKNPVFGQCNADFQVALQSLSGPLLTASGQYIQWSGSIKMT